MILLRKATIYDQRSAHHKEEMDVLIDDGIISKIARTIRKPSGAMVYESDNLSISPGWLDIGCFNGEPGYEYREDISSLCNAAAAGGYCGIAPFPTGRPVLDTKGQLFFLQSLAQHQTVTIHPIAALSKERLGNEIAELIDLYHGGAIAFSDGTNDRLDSAQLQRCMLYLKSFDGITIYAACKATGGHVHEGKVSVQMGLEGLADHLETTNILQVIRQSEYARAKVLIHNISTTECLKEVKSSSNNDQISFSVPFMNLILKDQDVLEFDLQLKTLPPLRSNRKQLVKGVASGEIEVISSNHTPLSKEEKDQPFGISDFGASTIETVFPALNTYATNLSLEQIIYALSIGPHKVLELDCPVLEKGNHAKITVFDPSKEFLLTKENLQSKSANSPFLDQQMRGKVIGIINGYGTTL